jgi:hypothetical protein
LKQELQKSKTENKKTGEQVMKTNFKSQEKSQAQKTSLNVFAIIISLVILSLTVDAHGIWKSFIEMNNASKNDLAMVNSTENVNMKDGKNTSLTNSYSAYLEQETEEPLELEEWMTNTTYFSTSAILETETEKPLELEAWMTNENYFGQSTLHFDEEVELPLELEDWMLNENYFRNSRTEEQPMALENWMIAENYWN